MRTLTLFVAIVAALFFASPGHAFNWDMFVPAITSCDSYPFPSCRARTLCKSEGKHWYNNRCNTEKHPDQEALEKLDGYWRVSLLFCGGDISLGLFILDKTKISDDNLQVAQYEGKTMSIVDRNIYMPPEPGSDYGPSPYYLYAIVGDSPGSYVLKDISFDGGMGFACFYYLTDGTVAEDHMEINAGDTGIYSFNLVSKDKMVGRVCFVNAGACHDFIGEKLPHSIYP